MTTRKLDFLIAGVQKAGTTALHVFLSQHPDIFLPQRKELHFFDQERKVDWTDPDYSRLHDWFHDRRDEQLAGEATPIYTFWKPSLPRIHAYNPAIKLIVLLRNPVERAYSHWAMQVARGVETASFSQAIRQSASKSRRDGRRQSKRFSYVERGFYSEQMERLLALFPHDQLLFLRNEDLRRKHDETLDQVCDFLGVKHFSVYPDAAYTGGDQARARRVQASNLPPPSEADIAYLADLYRGDLQRASALTALDLSSWSASPRFNT